MDLKEFYRNQGKSNAQSAGFGDIEPPNFSRPQESKGFDLGATLGGFAGGVSEMGGQAVSGLANVASNTLKGTAGALDVVNPINLAKRAVGQEPVNIAQTLVSPITGAIDYSTQAISNVQTQAGRNPNSMAGSFGRGLGTVAGTVGSSMIGGGVGSKLGAAIGGAGSKIMPFLGASFGSTEASMLGSSGRVASPQELAFGLGTDVVFAGAAKLAQPLGKAIRNVAYSDVIRATPTEKALLAARGIDIGEEMAKTAGVATSKKQLADRLQRKITSYQSLVDDAIAKADAGQLTTQDAAQEMIAGIGKAKKEIFELTKQVPRSARTKILKAVESETKEIEKDLAGKFLSASGVEEARREAFKRVNWDKLTKGQQLQYQITNPAEFAQGLVNRGVGQAGGDILDRIDPSILTNKSKQAPLIELKKIIEKRGNLAGGMTDAIAGAGATIAGNPAAAIPAAIMGRVMQSVPVRTAAGYGGHLLSKSAPAINALGVGVKNLILAGSQQQPRRQKTLR